MKSKLSNLINYGVPTIVVIGVLIVGFLLGQTTQRSRFNKLKDIDKQMLNYSVDVIEQTQNGWDCKTADCYNQITKNVNEITEKLKPLKDQREELVK